MGLTPNRFEDPGTAGTPGIVGMILTPKDSGYIIITSVNNFDAYQFSCFLAGWKNHKRQVLFEQN